MSRNVLVVAVGFPAMGASGGQRTGKLVKYLPEFGWRAASFGLDDSPAMGLLGRSLVRLVRQRELAAGNGAVTAAWAAA